MEEKSTETLIRLKEDREMLRERAAKLALKSYDSELDESEKGQVRDNVVFSMGGDTYAIEVAAVSEVLGFDEIVNVPCTPDFLRGVVSVRGHLCAVLDLCVFFGLGSGCDSGKRTVLFLRDETKEIGIVIESVTDVIPISGSRLNIIAEGRDTVSRYALGVTADRVTVLDGQRLLAEESFVVNEYVGSI